MLNALHLARDYNNRKVIFYKKGYRLNKSQPEIDDEFKQYFYNAFYDTLYDKGIKNIERGYQNRCNGIFDGDYYDYLKFSFKQLKEIRNQLIQIQDGDLKSKLINLVDSFPNELKQASSFINPKNIDNAYNEVFNTNLKNEEAAINENEENDFKKSTIDDYLISFQEDGIINKEDYIQLKNLLYNYFSNIELKNLSKKAFLKYSNKRRFANALGNLYRALENGKFKFDFFELIRNNINQFEEEIFNEDNYVNSNLMKYLTTKPQNKPTPQAKYFNTHSVNRQIKENH